MKDINEYINKINKIAKKEENVKFMPITADKIDKSQLTHMNDELKDYKELKELAKNLEDGLSVAGKEAVPVVIPIDSKRRR